MSQFREIADQIQDIQEIEDLDQTLEKDKLCHEHHTNDKKPHKCHNYRIGSIVDPNIILETIKGKDPYNIYDTLQTKQWEVSPDYRQALIKSVSKENLKFDEFETMLNQTIYVSATPADYELQKTEGVFIEQVIRPTG